MLVHGLQAVTVHTFHQYGAIRQLKLMEIFVLTAESLGSSLETRKSELAKNLLMESGAFMNTVSLAR